MRLIDAEKFEVFNATCPIPKGIRSGKIAAYFYVEGCRKVLEAIDAAPTIDQETLWPMAHWITDSGGSTNVACSACNAISFAAYNFFPHCGAMMVNANESL